MAMFVYLVGNVEQNIFRLGMAGDPARQLPSIQAGNPYPLSVVSEVCVRHKNTAAIVISLGRRDLSEYEEAGEWIVNVPAGLAAQFVNGHYLRAIADKAGIQIMGKDERAIPRDSDDLQRLTAIAKRKGFTFQDVLDRVEKAYFEGSPIDETI